MLSVNSVRILVFLSLAAVVAGCSSSGVGGLNLGQKKQQTDVDPKLGAKVVQGSCPRVELRDGTANFTKYARGGEDDREKVTYQASISDSTRQCSVTGDQLTINVVVAGRVLAGPAGKAGPLKLPIRVAVLEKGSNEVIFSELTQFETSLPEGNPTTQFLFNKPDVVIPITASRSVRIFVGFDEGPGKKS